MIFPRVSGEFSQVVNSEFMVGLPGALLRPLPVMMRTHLLPEFQQLSMKFSTASLAAPRLSPCKSSRASTGNLPFFKFAKVFLSLPLLVPAASSGNLADFFMRGGFISGGGEGSCLSGESSHSSNSPPDNFLKFLLLRRRIIFDRQEYIIFPLSLHFPC